VAEDLPAAEPLTVTCCTRPSEPKTTTALEGASSPATQWRAPLITEPSAAWTAPVVGLAGKPPLRLSAGRSAGSGGNPGSLASAAARAVVEPGLFAAALDGAAAPAAATLLPAESGAGASCAGRVLGSMPRGASSARGGWFCASAGARAASVLGVAVLGVGVSSALVGAADSGCLNQSTAAAANASAGNTSAILGNGLAGAAAALAGAVPLATTPLAMTFFASPPLTLVGTVSASLDGDFARC